MTCSSFSLLSIHFEDGEQALFYYVVTGGERGLSYAPLMRVIVSV
jgi:hypothetical protein